MKFSPRKRKSLAGLIILLALTLGGAMKTDSAQAGVRDFIHEQVTPYLKAGNESAYKIRFFLKDEIQNDNPCRRFLGGLFRERDRERKLFLERWFPREKRPSPLTLVDHLHQLPEFTPLKASFEWLVAKPLAWSSEKLTGTRKALTRPMAIAIGAPAAYLASNYTYEKWVDEPFQDQLKQKIDRQIQAEGGAYRKLILNDYRFQELKESLKAADLAANSTDSLEAKEGRTKRQESYRRAFLIQNSYSEYYTYLNGLVTKVQADHPEVGPNELKVLITQKLRSIEVQKDLEKFVLFSNIQKLISQGITADMIVGFEVPQSKIGKPLSPEIKADLFEIDHRLHIQYDLIRRAWEDSAATSESSQIHAQITSVTHDPFAIQVIAALKSKNRHPSEAIAYLQENEYWKSQFQIWKKLGITRLKSDSPGKFTEEPLTLEQIQNEMIRDEILRKD